MGRAKVLIVDDESIVRETLQSLLEDEYDLSLCTCGEEAQKFAQEHLVDVALVDIRMQGMDGIEVLRILKNMDPDTEVIIITAHTSLETAIEAMKYGACGYIRKPFNFKELKEVLNKAVERKRKKTFKKE